MAGQGAGILPPNLAPSPVQVAQGEQGSVPVKKELESARSDGHLNTDVAE